MGRAVKERWVDGGMENRCLSPRLGEGAGEPESGLYLGGEQAGEWALGGGKGRKQQQKSWITQSHLGFGAEAPVAHVGSEPRCCRGREGEGRHGQNGAGWRQTTGEMQEGTNGVY